MQKAYAQIVDAFFLKRVFPITAEMVPVLTAIAVHLTTLK